MENDSVLRAAPYFDCDSLRYPEVPRVPPMHRLFRTEIVISIPHSGSFVKRLREIFRFSGRGSGKKQEAGRGNKPSPAGHCPAYLYLRFLAASDFFLRFTLGFS